MIELGAEHRLGRKSFFLLLSHKTGVGLVLVLVSLILLAASGEIIQGIAGAMSLGSHATPAGAATISAGVSYVISAFFLVGLILSLVGFIACRLQYDNYTYSFGEFDLRLKKGIFNKKETSIPYRQIQDVNIERSLGHQMLGLSKVTMMTAGHEEAGEQGMSQIVLEPIEKELAEEVRAFLERKIGVQVTEDQSVADREAAAGPFPPAAAQ
jgi:uncharacterized membrane protein YdbT with pleckstrin-like domain